VDPAAAAAAPAVTEPQDSFILRIDIYQELSAHPNCIF
jgi:hypothetical protein